MLRIFCIFIIIYLTPNALRLNQAQAFFYFEEEKTVEVEQAEEENKATAPSINTPRSKIEIVKPISSFEQQKQDLTHYFSQSKTQFINTADNEYVLIEESSATQNNKGVAILLPDWQSGLTNPKSMNYLRKTLPKKGWTTLSIQSPNKPTNYPSSASKKSEQLEQNKSALMPYKNELKNLMMQIMKKANNYPGIFLVVTEGSQAAMLVDLYKADQDLSPNALVILSAGMYSEFENDTFAKNIATSELPILDLMLTKDSNLAIENAKLRKKYTTKEMKITYRQKFLTNTYFGYYPEQTLLTEINGWLKSMGW